ncbi:uncharacterized protein [Dysidea avara]|uniref:uncharacterized protein isoform X3 n=1 Tax=Dysidea avara TaxID=196820 RepID=UPI00332270D7
MELKDFCCLLLSGCDGDETRPTKWRQIMFASVISQGKPSRAIPPNRHFVVSKDKWDTKEDTGYVPLLRTKLDLQHNLPDVHVVTTNDRLLLHNSGGELYHAVSS